MPRRQHICFTFVGTVTRDSRLRRFVRTAAQIADVSILVLTDDPSASLPDATVVSVPRKSSLRHSLPQYWRTAADSLPSRGADLFFAADLYSLLLAARLAAAGSARLVYDSRELYRAIAGLEGRWLTQRFWSWLERRYARRADAVITVNGSIADILASDYARVQVLHNYPDAVADRAPDGSGRLRSAFNISGTQPVLLSQGGLQRGRGALLCIDALARIDDAALVFLGNGPMRDEILLHAQVQGVGDRVHVHPAVPSGELLQWTAGADIGLCMIENLGRSYYLSLPNKLFEYIAAGLPVVGSDFPEISRVLRESGAGIAVPPENADALADTLRQLLTEPARIDALKRRSQAVRTQYQWSGEEPKLRTLLEELLERRED